jgi:hypothetical protein
LIISDILQCCLNIVQKARQLSEFLIPKLRNKLIFPILARMPVPKLVCEVPYASGSAWFVGVYGCLGCEEHDEEAELSVERYFSQPSQVVLG